MFKAAYDFAKLKHAGQKRWGGEDYFTDHLETVVYNALHLAKEYRVSSEFSEKVRTVAILHDVVEDTDATLMDLAAFLPQDVVDAVDAITKRENELYNDYIYRVRQNILAMIVKVADIQHNSSSIKEGNKRQLYLMTKNYLVTILNNVYGV